MLDKNANFPGSLAARPFAKPRRGFWSIANQLRFSFLALVLLSLLPTGGALIYLSSQAQQTLSQELQAQISQGAAAEVNNYLDDLQRKVAYLARVPGLADLPPPVLQSLLKGLTRHNDAYEAIAILDEEGRVVTAISSYMPVMFGSWADTPAFGRASPAVSSPRMRRSNFLRRGGGLVCGRLFLVRAMRSRSAYLASIFTPGRSIFTDVCWLS